jgi:hypothetical protein
LYIGNDLVYGQGKPGELGGASQTISPGSVGCRHFNTVSRAVDIGTIAVQLEPKKPTPPDLAVSGRQREELDIDKDPRVGSVRENEI